MSRSILIVLLASSWLAAAAGCAPAGSADRPRLFVKAEHLAALRERARTTHQKYLLIAQAVFDADIKSPPEPLASPKGMDDWKIEPWTARLLNAAILWAATGEPAVAEQVRKWLADWCCVRPTVNNSYTYGHYALALAVAYDFLHDVLAADERAQVVRQLAAVCQSLYESGAKAWWQRLYLHHDCWIPTAGLGVGALALAGQDDRWRIWYRFAREELTAALDLLGDGVVKGDGSPLAAPDGAWPEGPSGWTYGMAALLPFLEAARNVTGEDLYARSGWLKNTARARLYLRLPNGQYFNYGDAHRDGRYGGTGSTPTHLLRLLAARYQDGLAQWLAEQEEQADLRLCPWALAAATQPASSGSADERGQAARKGDSLLLADDLKRGPSAQYADGPVPENANCWFYGMAWSLLWHDPAIPAVPPDRLPTCRVLANLGYVVARTGWGADAAFLSFRAGPMVGQAARQTVLRGGGEKTFANRVIGSVEHAHQDQNAFTFFARGVYWVSPPGYGARSSARHSTLLLGNRQQVKDTLEQGVLLAHEFADGYVYLLGDAPRSYPAEVGLERFDRHVVWLQPDVVVICDDVRTVRPAAVQWRMRPDAKLPPPTIHADRVTLVPPTPKSPAPNAAAPDPNTTTGLSATGPDSPPTAMTVRFLRPATTALIGPTTQPTDEEQRDRKTLGYVRRMAYVQAAATQPAQRTVFLTVLSPEDGNTRATQIDVAGGVGVRVERGPASVVGTGGEGSAGSRRRQAVIFAIDRPAHPSELHLAYPAPPSGAHERCLIVGLPPETCLSIHRGRSPDGTATVGLTLAEPLGKAGSGGPTPVSCRQSEPPGPRPSMKTSAAGVLRLDP